MVRHIPKNNDNDKEKEQERISIVGKAKAKERSRPKSPQSEDKESPSEKKRAYPPRVPPKEKIEKEEPQDQETVEAEKSALKEEIDHLRDSLKEIKDLAGMSEGDSKDDLEQKVASLQKEIGLIEKHIKINDNTVENKNEPPVQDKTENLEEEKVEAKKEKASNVNTKALKESISKICDILVANKIKIIVSVLVGLIIYFGLKVSTSKEYEALVELEIEEKIEDIGTFLSHMRAEIKTERNLINAINNIESLPSDKKKKDKQIKKLVREYTDKILIEKSENNNINISVKSNDPEKAAKIMRFVTHNYLLAQNEEYRQKHYGKLIGKYEDDVNKQIEIIESGDRLILLAEASDVFSSKGVSDTEINDTTSQFANSFDEEKEKIQKQLYSINQALSKVEDANTSFFFRGLASNLDVLDIRREFILLELNKLWKFIGGKDDSGQSLKSSGQISAKAVLAIKDRYNKESTLEVESLIALYVRKLSLEGRLMAIQLLFDSSDIKTSNEIDYESKSKAQEKMVEASKSYGQLLKKKEDLESSFSNNSGAARDAAVSFYNRPSKETGGINLFWIILSVLIVLLGAGALALARRKRKL